MKLVFFGSSNFALPVLEALHGSHEIAAVVTTPDLPAGRARELKENPVSVLAKQLRLPVLKPDAVKNNPEFAVQLKNLDADVFIVSAYGLILPEEIINLPKFKTLNTHPSLLPKYRGPSPIQIALKDGLTETGTSIMVLDTKMDTGPILAQEQCVIEASDTYISLSEKLSKLSAHLLIKILPEYQSGALSPVAQTDADATYTTIISRDNGKIDWSQTATEIHNLFRAFTPWPGIWTNWEGRKIKITDCEVYEGDPAVPGVFSCGQSTFLKINKLQLEGKKETDIASFLNGHKDFIGTKLQ
jgi:methionyl-tRNA formyltransferase